MDVGKTDGPEGEFLAYPLEVVNEGLGPSLSTPPPTTLPRAHHR